MQKSFHQNSNQIQQDMLWVELSKKDPAKFEKLYNKYFNQIAQYIYLRLESKSVALDLTQQVFIKALNKIHQFKDRGLPFSSWLCRIASNQITDYFRSNSKMRTVVLEDYKVSHLFDDAELENVDISEQITLLKKALDEISEIETRIIEMRFFEKMPFKTIAEILDITENNAKVKTYRILDKLKKLMLKA